jgi:hypothetical protein
MRRLLYKLSNGTVVNTMREAKASGRPYEVVFEEIVEKSSPLTEKQRANRKAIR